MEEHALETLRDVDPVDLESKPFTGSNANVLLAYQIDLRTQVVLKTRSSEILVGTL